MHAHLACAASLPAGTAAGSCMQVFPFQGSKSGSLVSGCRVNDGSITKTAQYRVLRDGATVFTGRQG